MLWSKDPPLANSSTLTFQRVGIHHRTHHRTAKCECCVAINVFLRKGAAENPFVSGILVGPVENLIVPKPRPHLRTRCQCRQGAVRFMYQQRNGFHSRTVFIGIRERSHTARINVSCAQREGSRPCANFHGFGHYHYEHRIIGRATSTTEGTTFCVRCSRDTCNPGNRGRRHCYLGSVVTRRSHRTCSTILNYSSSSSSDRPTPRRSRV